jgi:hypothetical protein
MQNTQAVLQNIFGEQDDNTSFEMEPAPNESVCVGLSEQTKLMDEDNESIFDTIEHLK